MSGYFIDIRMTINTSCNASEVHEKIKEALEELFFESEVQDITLISMDGVQTLFEEEKET